MPEILRRSIVHPVLGGYEQIVFDTTEEATKIALREAEKYIEKYE